jgi:hypothetical protein
LKGAIPQPPEENSKEGLYAASHPRAEIFSEIAQKLLDKIFIKLYTKMYLKLSVNLEPF